MDYVRRLITMRQSAFTAALEQTVAELCLLRNHRLKSVRFGSGAAAG